MDRFRFEKKHLMENWIKVSVIYSGFQIFRHFLKKKNVKLNGPFHFQDLAFVAPKKNLNV